ncbi:carbohydrate ABC transporter membrane protein 1, CUT1 family [Marinilactibacillus piezotolerans]|uniref:Carbohydrate ABC transporter membrane protein 1, CUT1 family n=1 Tax=Marinilactibacillus piezotolerans TaxID=258723 RepID=A0A1I4ALD6_9LACT|nr:sugar ABC transporter permease [Marinilactibacillus piezotolerans]SFK57184.1 carbohydrate ABC transporter membrane protein 1, CUT1 family [Marinilactibacillus piezotolerans]
MIQKPTLKSSLKSLLYIAPMMLIVGTFNLYPIVRSFLMSFYADYNIFTGEVSSYGINNFIDIFKDPEFILAIRNTFIFVLGVVPASIAISLGIAILLNRVQVLSGFFRSIYFLPFVTSTVAISIVWGWIYHSRFGLLNYALGLLGFSPIEFLTDPSNSMLALIIMAIWKGLGFNIILFLVGLNNIDGNYYSAAKIDGAKGWQRFTNITLPLLGPTMFLVSVMGVINSFKVFDEVFALFQSRPGPAGSAMTVVYYIFQKFYQESQYGIAAAAGIVLFLIILVFTLVQMAFNKKFVHY